MAVSGQDLRQVMRRWATGVTVVTSHGPRGRHGITVNSFTSLSLDPPLCLICIKKDAVAHQAIPDAGGFAVNLLAADQAEVSARFAGMRPDVADPFMDLELDRSPAGHPVFAGALGYLECTLEADIAGGDHTIFVGRVAHAQALADTPPLLWYGGRYRNLTSD